VKISRNWQPKALPMASMLGMMFTAGCWSTDAWAQAVVTTPVPKGDPTQGVNTGVNLPKLPQATLVPSIAPQTFPTVVSASTNIPPSTQAQDLLASESIGTIKFEGKVNPILIADETQGASAETLTEEQSKPRKRFMFHFGSELPDPTALSGPTRSPIVPASERIKGGASVSGGVQVNISKAAKLFLEVKGGESVIGGDLSLFYGSDDLRSGVAFNVFEQRGYSPSFYRGRTRVNLPNGKQPWVDRLGGGFEIRHPLTPKLQSTVGLTYQSVSIRDDFFASKKFAVDQLGNPLTVSGTGRDDLLTLNLGLQYDTRDKPEDPTKGTRLRFGLDQSIPTGNGNIGMTRLSGSASQFFPVPFFSNKKKSVFVANVQGGHILGDAPPYEAFSLGGDDTVRGFQTADVGTGRSFLQASAEYRFPMFDLKLFKQPIDVGGVLFVDYGSLLGTQNEVIGQPGVVRNKPGDGLGYGLGVRLGTRFGIIRVEVGFNDRGDVEPHFSVGERF
jgi:outer membrane protein insertion porin family